MIIWLRGGTTYYYHSNYPQTPLFTSSSLLVESVSYAPKTQADSYVNINGLTLSGGVWATSSLSNYFKGNVGIGTNNPKKIVGCSRYYTCPECGNRSQWLVGFRF